MKLAAILPFSFMLALAACDVAIDDQPQLPPDAGPSALVTREMYLYRPSGPKGGVAVCILRESPEGDCIGVVPEGVTELGFDGRLVVVKRKAYSGSAEYYIFDMVEDPRGLASLGPVSQAGFNEEASKRRLPPLKPLPQLKVGPPWPPSEV
ncbi:hypothetical protein [Asticcacaulis solisilvae]|uniref:hypothetical protein n=1 Tax=Asticcacaulis solisilvae TaxID=1217274 RepID=UPI003FD72CD6